MRNSITGWGSQLLAKLAAKRGWLPVLVIKHRNDRNGESPFQPSSQWIGLRENLQETIDFPMEDHGAFR